ncbi:hypothetical protein K3495_g9166 [Podosphaera aphanis]|nr:hypothetical protein K3495_g9166 [Podosphaera aphanis]
MKKIAAIGTKSRISPSPALTRKAWNRSGGSDPWREPQLFHRLLAPYYARQAQIPSGLRPAAY